MEIEYKKYAKSIVIILTILIIIQGICLITNNAEYFKLLTITIWLIMFFNIGTIIGYKLIK